MVKWLIVGVVLILAYVAYLFFQSPPKREPSERPVAAVEAAKTQDKAEAEDAAEKKGSENAEDKLRKEAEEKIRKEETAAAVAGAETKKNEAAAQLEERLRKAGEIKERMEKVARALREMGSNLVEEVALDEDARKQARSLRAKMNSARDALLSLKEDVSRAEAERRSVASSLKDSRSSSERIGWRYTNESDGACHPMEMLPKNRTKPVKYLYAERTTKDDRLEAASKKLEDLKRRLPELEAAKAKTDDDYEKFCADYKSRLLAESRELASKRQELLADSGSAKAQEAAVR